MKCSSLYSSTVHTCCPSMVRAPEITGYLPSHSQLNSPASKQNSQQQAISSIDCRQWTCSDPPADAPQQAANSSAHTRRACHAGKRRPAAIWAAAEDPAASLPARRARAVGESSGSVCLVRRGLGRGRRRVSLSVLRLIVHWKIWGMVVDCFAGSAADNTISSPASSAPSSNSSAANLRSRSIHDGENASQHASPSHGSGLTSSMMRTVVSSGNDALNLLFEAAAHTNTQNGQLERHHTRDAGARNDYNNNDYRPAAQNMQTPGPGSVGTSPAAPAPVDISNPGRDVLDVWESCRFVKMGWFTAKEAITYVDR